MLVTGLVQFMSNSDEYSGSATLYILVVLQENDSNAPHDVHWLPAQGVS